MKKVFVLHCFFATLLACSSGMSRTIAWVEGNYNGEQDDDINAFNGKTKSNINGFTFDIQAGFLFEMGLYLGATYVLENRKEDGNEDRLTQVIDTVDTFNRGGYGPTIGYIGGQDSDFGFFVKATYLVVASESQTNSTSVDGAPNTDISFDRKGSGYQASLGIIYNLTDFMISAGVKTRSITMDEEDRNGVTTANFLKLDRAFTRLFLGVGMVF